MQFDQAKARDFLYGKGTLLERALFAWLFDGGPLERLHQIILCYKNPDKGFGHGLEHDLKAPQSNPLALEYLLGVMKHTGVPPGSLLAGTSDWLETQMDEQGNLLNPPETRDYPLAPWWREQGGQTMPDSIVGNLIRFDSATQSLIDKTARWALAHYTPDKIRRNEWLFMAYHAFDYFFAVDDFPALAGFQNATIENIVACAAKAPENQLDSIFVFAPTPDSMIAKALPEGLLQRSLDLLSSAQQEDGHWRDQHNLPQWYPMTTINVLLALKRYGRWS
ncbi:MAG: hypothetical protein OXI34_18045 [Chloroflexota bacterium]|nr:hypothetical protein [Chloroflexota bacterium]MDE2945955.1 hypothetical protein [Chloroflexota bacterium]